MTKKKDDPAEEKDDPSTEKKDDPPKSTALAPMEVIDFPAVRKRVDDLVKKGVKERRAKDPPKISSGRDRVERENVAESIAQIIADLSASGVSATMPASWPSAVRADVFGKLQLCWAAAIFERAGAAKLLGVSPKMVDAWLDSPEWTAWATDPERRVEKLSAVTDLALERAADILTRDSNDPRFISIQAGIVKQVLKGGMPRAGRMLDDGKGQTKPDAPPDEPTMHDNAQPEEKPTPVITMNGDDDDGPDR